MELPKTLITEATLTSTVTTIEITSGIDASYNAYEFLVMNGQTNVTGSTTSAANFQIGQSGTYSLNDVSLSNYGGNTSWSVYFGPHTTSSTGVNVLLRAVFLRPSGSSYNKTAFLHGGSSFLSSSFASGIVLAETTWSTAAVNRVKLTVNGGSWVANTRYKLYGYK